MVQGFYKDTYYCKTDCAKQGKKSSGPNKSLLSHQVNGIVVTEVSSKKPFATWIRVNTQNVEISGVKGYKWEVYDKGRVINTSYIGQDPQQLQLNPQSFRLIEVDHDDELIIFHMR